MVRVTSLGLMVLLAACSTSAPVPTREATGEASASVHASAAAAPTEWVEPTAYFFVLESQCGERTLTGRFAVEVEGGRVISVAGLDLQGRTALSALPAGDVPTLAELLTLIGEARRDGADAVDVVLDPADGRPVSVQIDWLAHAVDDEECYEVSDYVVRRWHAPRTRIVRSDGSQ